MGYIIYSGELAESLLGEIKEELDGMLVDLKSGKINKGQVTEHMDELLFKKYYISMLSDGFLEFYIYKHNKLDSR